MGVGGGTGAGGLAITGLGGGGGSGAGATGFGRGRGAFGCTACRGCVGVCCWLTGLATGGGGALSGAPQKPQNLLPKGSVFRQRGQVSTPAAGRKGCAASCPGIGLPHREQVADVAGFGAPHAGQRVYRMVPCSLASLAMAVSLCVGWEALTIVP